MAWATREAAEPRTQLIRVAEADDLWETGSDFIYSIVLPPGQTVIGEIGLHRRGGGGGVGIGVLGVAGCAGRRRGTGGGRVLSEGSRGPPRGVPAGGPWE